MNKRDFIKTLGTASTLTLLNPLNAFGALEKINKKVLMLGGRGLIGPSIVIAFLNAVVRLHL